LRRNAIELTALDCGERMGRKIRCSSPLAPSRTQCAESCEARFERSVRALEALRLCGATDKGRMKPAPPDSNASLASVLPVTVATKLRMTAAETKDMPVYLRAFFRLLSSWVHYLKPQVKGPLRVVIPAHTPATCVVRGRPYAAVRTHPRRPAAPRWVSAAWPDGRFRARPTRVRSVRGPPPADAEPSSDRALRPAGARTRSCGSGSRGSAELLFHEAGAPLRLLPEGSERLELTSRLDHLHHRVGAERADQLVLEVLDAGVEPEPLHVGAREPGSEPRPLKPAAEVRFLRRVVQPGQGDAEPTRPESIENRPTFFAPPMATTETPSALRMRPHREATTSSASRSLIPSTRMTARTFVVACCSIAPPVDSVIDAASQVCRCTLLPRCGTQTPCGARRSRFLTVHSKIRRPCARAPRKGTVWQALTRPVVSAKVPLNWNRDTPAVSATILAALSAPTLASPPYHSSGQHPRGVAASSPRVFHPHPVAEFFLATADGPVTVDREPGADAAPRARLESQAKPNRLVDAHEMLVHDVDESLI
jgi:hypothetical protein